MRSGHRAPAPRWPNGESMNPLAKSVLAAWRPDPWLMSALVVTAAIYLRGWRRLHAVRPRRFGRGRAAAFTAGLAAILVAVGSPVDAFAGLLLQAHMVQHLLLTMVAPPLLLLGAPVLPLLRGLPRPVVRRAVGPVLTLPEVEWLGGLATHPVFAWLAFTIAMLGWHVPALYELALHSGVWHVVEHGCFFAAALLFWWPVLEPWPSRARWPRWSMIVYLVLADLQNTALSASLIFAERVIYPTYANGPRLWSISPLDDQAAAGALMWVPGSLVFLLPACWIALEALDSNRGVRPSAALGGGRTGTAT